MSFSSFDFPGSTTPPATAVGTGKIDTWGGLVKRFAQDSTLGGHVALFAAGAIDASCALPSPASVAVLIDGSNVTP